MVNMHVAGQKFLYQHLIMSNLENKNEFYILIDVQDKGGIEHSQEQESIL